MEKLQCTDVVSSYKSSREHATSPRSHHTCKLDQASQISDVITDDNLSCMNSSAEAGSIPLQALGLFASPDKQVAVWKNLFPLSPQLARWCILPKKDPFLYPHLEASDTALPAEAHGRAHAIRQGVQDT